MAPALQITIPQTSIAAPTDGSKPYTQYHIHLQLPLRLHQVRKRYTDFTNLHSALTTETKAAPPAPLPPKSWLRRTVNNGALTEERRKGLETYIQRIVNADDARWRSSTAWRSFLNLPGATTTSTAGSSSGDGTRPSTSGSISNLTGGIRDPNEWLDVHRSLKAQIQAARSQLQQRDTATSAQQQHARSAEAKASLVRAATAISQLEDGLKRFTAASQGDGAGWGGSQKLGAGEIRRRRDLLSAAKSEVEGLEGVLKSMVTRPKPQAAVSDLGAAATPGEREALWRGTSVGAKPAGRVLGGPAKETERTRELNNNGVLQLQQQIMKDQDEDVLALGKTVAKLKDMGILINEELEIQNEMLGLIDQDVDRVQGKIDVGRRRIQKIK